jgi:hypothetical protein
VIAISKPNPIDGGHQREWRSISVTEHDASPARSPPIFQTKELAKRYFCANRPLIEQKARNRVEQRGALNGEVNLEIA